MKTLPAGNPIRRSPSLLIQPELQTALPDLYIAGSADAQLLTLIKLNVFAALAEDPGCPNSGSYGRAHGCADTATCDSANDRANADRGAYFLDVAFRRAGALHATFRIDLAHTLTSARNHFNYLGAHLCRAAIRESDFVKRKLQLRGALCLARTLHIHYPALERGAFILFRLEHARLEVIALM